MLDSLVAVLWFKMFSFTFTGVYFCLTSSQLSGICQTTRSELMYINIITSIDRFQVFLLGYVGRKVTMEKTCEAGVMSFILEVSVQR